MSEKITCAFLDRECGPSCMAYDEDGDGCFCRRIDGEHAVRFKNWLYVEHKQAKQKESRGNGRR